MEYLWSLGLRVVSRLVFLVGLKSLWRLGLGVVARYA